MSNYTNEDKIILDYFFTNLDRPVFVAKNFHPEVWALMQARYSRSTEGMRESFLKLLKEDITNYNLLLDFIKESNSGEVMKHSVKKAVEFMDKWVLGYGHSSVAEAATIGIGLEGISILATKVIEDNRLASYIEKSTRYVSFGSDSFYIPEKLKSSPYGKESEEFIKELFNVYMELHEPILNYIKSSFPLQQGQNKNAWERSCKARRFDAIRYLLPACTKTSLGWTVNARQLAYAISKLKSHPLEEMKTLGDQIKEEATKILPSLLKYAEENRFIIETENEMRRYSVNLPRKTKAVELVEATKNIDDILISAIIYRYSNASYKDIKNSVIKMDNSQKNKIYDSFLRNIGDFDSLHREFEHATVTFDILVDYGAFRDIQRHRMCTQTNQLLTTEYGYEIPEDIINAGEEILDKYNKMMKKAEDLYEKIASEDKYLAQYIVPLAFRKRVLITMNLREAFYFIKLRSKQQGHISYRRIAKEMYDLLRQEYPIATKYFCCDLSDDELGRMAQESKFEEKIAKMSYK